MNNEQLKREEKMKNEQLTGNNQTCGLEQFSCMKSMNFSARLRKFLYFFCIFHCSLFIVNCDLFAPADPNFINDLYAELAWANAVRLNVRLDYADGWIISPAPHQLDREKTRKSHAFDIEVEVSTAFGFANNWLAFYTEDYDALPNKGLGLEIEDVQDIVIDDKKIIEIEPVVITGSRRSVKVTIHTTDDITIVPWCSNRPRVASTNPPIINTGINYGTRQPIRIVFDMLMDKETAEKKARDLLT